MIDLFGVAVDFGGPSSGSRMGPAALRMQGIAGGLRELGLSVQDQGDISVGPSNGMTVFPPVLDAVAKLRTAVFRSLSSGNTALVLGGEHTAALGGVAAALEVYDGDLALLWIDAHAAVSTFTTFPMLGLEKMAVGALQGRECDVKGALEVEWKELQRTLGPHRLRSDRTAWFGLRDVAIEEQDCVRSGLGLTMSEIDRYRIPKCVDRINDFFVASQARNIWISLDVDVLDLDNPVREGLTYREVHLLAELLYERFGQGAYTLAGVSVVDVNPLTDNGDIAIVGVKEWLLSLFGKTIL